MRMMILIKWFSINVANLHIRALPNLSPHRICSMRAMPSPALPDVRPWVDVWGYFDFSGSTCRRQRWNKGGGEREISPRKKKKSAESFSCILMPKSGAILIISFTKRGIEQIFSINSTF